VATTSKQGSGRQQQAVPPARAAWTPPPVVPVVPPPRPPLVRPTSGRVLAGVAAGLAGHLGVPVRLVRIGLVLAVALGGIGVVLYLWLWALVPSGHVSSGQTAPPADGPASAPSAAPWAAGPPGGRVADLLIGGLLLLAAGALLSQRFGYDVSLSLVLPLLVVIGGAVLAYTQLDEVERSRWATFAGSSTRGAILRVVAGLVLVLVGVLVVVVRGDLASAGRALVAAVAVLAGAAVVLAPWGLRLWRDLDAERAARAREAERSEIAAHLHDSVLQTLALIQRRSDDPVQVARLARAQERDLRSWLYGGGPVDAASVAAQVKEAAAEVEDRHGTSIDVVVVGDRPADERTSALVAALREAMVNAVKHGRPTSAGPVQVYVEAGADGVEAFVRDRGPGFDPDAVPADRLGVRESIVARMQRHGGSGTVRSTAGEGTEVRLEMPADRVEAATRE
jgi:signal transduction histidine kinase/phage shock protein PspC (stress-responsive transcriptional regulator)